MSSKFQIDLCVVSFLLFFFLFHLFFISFLHYNKFMFIFGILEKKRGNYLWTQFLLPTFPYIFCLFFVWLQKRASKNESFCNPKCHFFCPLLLTGLLFLFTITWQYKAPNRWNLHHTLFTVLKHISPFLLNRLNVLVGYRLASNCTKVKSLYQYFRMNLDVVGTVVLGWIPNSLFVFFVCLCIFFL